MTDGTLTITDATGRQAMVCVAGAGPRPWAVGCVDADCAATIVGYSTRNQGVRGAEWHLKWHVNGKPICRECGAWLSRKGSARCRKGTCEVDR